jgi:hypothetical protein
MGGLALVEEGKWRGKEQEDEHDANNVYTCI